MENVNVGMSPGVMLFPGVMVYENVLKEPSKYVDLALANNAWHDSLIVSDDQGNDVLDSLYRSSMTLGLEPSGPESDSWKNIYSTIDLYAKEYSKSFGVAFSQMENIQMLMYPTNTGFFKPHADSSPEAPRIFSAILYLNDVLVGGETKFLLFDKLIKPKSGRLVIFPANYAYVHQALPPESNQKFVAVTWFK